MYVPFWVFRFIVFFCVLFLEMCIVLLPPGINPIAVNKYIISYQTILNNSIIHIKIRIMQFYANTTLFTFEHSCILQLSRGHTR